MSPAIKPKKTTNPDKLLAIVSTPAEEITPQAISDLRPAGYNPRVITAEQQKMLQASMKEYGDIGGIIFNVKTGRLVGGHQRIKQLDPQWPIVKQEQTDSTGTVAAGYIETPHGKFNYREVSWSETKEKAANVAANKMGGMFDDELLAQLLQELNDGGYDMSLTGFDEQELKDLLNAGKKETLGEEDPDVEPVPEPFVKLGDLWILGENRLLCGDSTSIADIDKLMMGDKADLVVTDPPYNVDIQGSENRAKPRSTYDRSKGTGSIIANDNMKPDDFETFLKAVFSCMEHALKKGGCFYIYHADGNGNSFPKTVASTPRLLVKQCLIWVKNSPTLGRQDYNYTHEPILYGWKEGSAHYFVGDFTLQTVIDDDVDIKKMSKPELQNIINEIRNNQMTTVIRHPRPVKNTIHPTMKPVGLIARNIYASSRTGEIVLDLFSGSATTIIACRKTGRKGRGVEFSPGYAQASLKRYFDYCGEEPMLMGADGMLTPYNEVEKQRAKK
jgi:DNA modification methylase